MSGWPVLPLMPYSHPLTRPHQQRASVPESMQELAGSAGDLYDFGVVRGAQEAYERAVEESDKW